MKPVRLLLAVAALAVPPIARADAVTVRFSCQGSATDPSVVESMENEYIEATGYGACWFHTGHHTYDAGGLFAVDRVDGSAFSVEVELSPPVEYAPAAAYQPSAALVFETSADGLAWSTLAQVPYPMFRSDPGQELFRHPLTFSFDGDGAVARYFRLRQPASAAQGLSGFLDASGFTAELTPVEAPPPAEPVSSRSLGCLDHVMERFFAAHPCAFGGINRYDSPSVFHTYPIGDSEVARVTGRVIFLPWRTDDYSSNGGGRTDVRGFLQSSADGVTWTQLAEVSGKYGAPIAFDVTPPGPVRASYLRIVAEYHKGVRGQATPRRSSTCAG